MTRISGILADAALSALIAASGCGVADVPQPVSAQTQAPAPAPVPPTSTGPIGAANVPLEETIDVAGSRAALEAGHAEIKRVLEDAIGTAGWTEMRAAQEVACPSRTDATGALDAGIGKFYAREMHHPEPVTPADWDRAQDEVARAVEPHGFRTKPTDDDAESPATDGRYIYLINDHSDELTLSVHPGIGTGYGGFGVCHPWEK